MLVSGESEPSSTPGKRCECMSVPRNEKSAAGPGMLFLKKSKNTLGRF
jgi:hypothetical protein